MSPITSPQNPRVRWVRSLAQEPKERRREGLWVAEGLRLAEEVLREGLRVRLWVTAAGWGAAGPREGRLSEAIRRSGAEVLEVAPGLLRQAADTQNPQGVLCVFEAPVWTVEDALASPGPLLVLDRLQDPGNVGTLARSAEAAGAFGLLFTAGSVDPGNPKALRASAGSLLRVPCAPAQDLPALLAASGRAVFATAGAGGTPYCDADLTVPFALLVGQEAAGLSPELAAAAHAVLTIPMGGRVESLNAATAASVILFEAARQRRLGNG